jgi:signal transduction histidine kinase
MFMKTLRTRLIVSHIVPLLILIPLLGIVVYNVVQSQKLLVELSHRVTDQAQVIVDDILTRPEIWTSSVQAQTYVDDFSRTLQMDITLIRPAGDVLASSDPDADNSSQVMRVQEFLRIKEEENGTRVERIILQTGPSDMQVSLPVVDANQQLLGVLQVKDQLEGVYSRFEQIQWGILALVIAGLIVAALVGLVLALRVEHNLLDVTRAIVRVADDSQLNAVPERGPDEIRAVLRAFNGLVKRLRESEDTRQQLLTNLVHEIGRPLGAMGSAVRALENGAYRDNELREQLLTGLDDHIQSMQPLLDNLVQLHKQVVGAPQLNLSETNFDEWLPKIINLWRPAAEEKRLEWNVELSPQLPILLIDQQKLAQAIGNLVSNAIKYTPSGGAITFSAQADAGNVIIAIEDTGAGIPADERDRIFEPFYRLHAGKRFPQGMGLGLSIARDIVKAHNGALTLMSNEPDTGSRFVIEIPTQSTLVGEA